MRAGKLFPLSPARCFPNRAFTSVASDGHRFNPNDAADHSEVRQQRRRRPQ
jgi:hypothetical protein